jgi:hypothetical protein
MIESSKCVTGSESIAKLLSMGGMLIDPESFIDASLMGSDRIHASID